MNFLAHKERSRRKASPWRPKAAAGLTLTEVLVTVAIVGITSAIGFPMLSSYIKDAGVSSQADSLLQSLQLTRTEAVKRNARVTMCRSTTGSSCSGDGNWRDGWIIFVDGDTAAIKDGTDEILRVQPAFAGKGDVIGTGDVTNYVSYTSNGQPRKADNAVQSGVFSICSDLATAKRRKISLSAGTGWVGVVIVNGSSTCTS